LQAGALRVDAPVASELWRWRDGVSGAVSTERGGKVSEDIVVPVARVADAVQMIHALGDRLGLPTCTWGHAGDGNIHASFVIDPRDAGEVERANRTTDSLFAIAIELGGGVTGEHGIGYLKRGQLANQWSEEAIALHERIKDTFDPTGILNPGKKLARVIAED
ncbi:MAG TPA: FAD-linked oxidase C-terminal domain-containing protein, partial [Solirubrobacteraceae bacterium]